MPRRSSAKSLSRYVKPALAILGAVACISVAIWFTYYITTNKNKENQSTLEICKMCFKKSDECNLACHPDNVNLVASMCILYTSGQKNAKDCLDLDFSGKIDDASKVSAKLNNCITSQKLDINFPLNPISVTQAYRDAWNSKCLGQIGRSLVGELRNIPDNKEANIHIPPYYDRVSTTKGYFKIDLPSDAVTADTVRLSIEVDGQPAKDEDIQITDFKTKKHGILYYNEIGAEKAVRRSGINAQQPLVVQSNALPLDYCLNEPIDYINQAKCAQEAYREDVALKEQFEPGNIIAETSNEDNVNYLNVNMRPSLYGSEGNGNQIKHEDGLPSSFYQVKISDKCYFKGGNTHGGFYYFVDKVKTPINQNYRISFYAWSTNAEGLSLRIQHSDGRGEVSSLSGTAMITKERKKFSWTGRLDNKQQNVPLRYIYGYLVDYPNRRPCEADPDHPEKFAGRSFVIGNFRLETWPDPAASP